MAKKLDEIIEKKETAESTKKIRRTSAGRPKSKTKRDQKLHAYVSKEELEKIEKAAADAGMTVSGFIRFKVLSN